MPNEDVHVSDQEMLLAVDGELSPSRAAEVRAHLAACPSCRARMAELDSSIATFARAYRQILDPRLPSIHGPRALLRARLAEPASKQTENLWRRLFNLNAATRAVFVGAAVLIAAVAGSIFVHRLNLRGSNSTG